MGAEDLSLAATSFLSFVVHVLLLDLTSASQRLLSQYRQPLHAVRAPSVHLRAILYTTDRAADVFLSTGSENACWAASHRQ